MLDRLFWTIASIPLTFPAESKPSMRIRTSLSLLQDKSDVMEPKRDETERPIRKVEETGFNYGVYK
jgi:hypothetical protein